MSKLASDSGNFLYKIKKWGSLNPGVNFLLFTDHTKENKSNLGFDFTFIVIAKDLNDFTRDLQWVNYFGKTEWHTLSKEEENQSIIVLYTQGPRVKFTFFESKMDFQETTSPPSKILVNKNL